LPRNRRDGSGCVSGKGAAADPVLPSLRRYPGLSLHQASPPFSATLLRTPGAAAWGRFLNPQYSLLSSACKPLHLRRVALRGSDGPEVEFSGFEQRREWLAKCTRLSKAEPKSKLLRLLMKAPEPGHSSSTQILWAIFIVLTALWIIAFAAHVGGGLITYLLVVSLAVVLIHSAATRPKTVPVREEEMKSQSSG